MSTKTKSPRSAQPAQLPVAQTPPWTTDERLKRIEAMGQRVNGYVQFMCALGNLNGTSTETRDKAIIAFYEKMVVLERQLALIQDEFKLE
jgi:hypothetical protein